MRLPLLSPIVCYHSVVTTQHLQLWSSKKISSNDGYYLHCCLSLSIVCYHSAVTPQHLQLWACCQECLQRVKVELVREHLNDAVHEVVLGDLILAVHHLQDIGEGGGGGEDEGIIARTIS